MAYKYRLILQPILSNQDFILVLVGTSRKRAIGLPQKYEYDLDLVLMQVLVPGLVHTGIFGNGLKDLGPLALKALHLYRMPPPALVPGRITTRY